MKEIFEYYHPTMNDQRNHMKKVCKDFEHITKAKFDDFKFYRMHGVRNPRWHGKGTCLILYPSVSYMLDLLYYKRLFHMFNS